MEAVTTIFEPAMISEAVMAAKARIVKAVTMHEGRVIDRATPGKDRITSSGGNLVVPAMERRARAVIYCGSAN
jgi:hypothetical protein